jgi:hypothetical protein
MRQLIKSVKAALRFRDYRPKPLSFLSARRWVNQFERKDRKLVGQLLDNVIYFSELRTRDILVAQNELLTKRLSNAGLSSKKLIYVQLHDAGSSSPVMLNLLRDAANLERLGCHLVDARDTLRLIRIMNKIGEGALIYVDDFVGSGDQFCSERDFAASNFVGTFSEFVLAPSICEEAFEELDKRGIQAFTGHKHMKEERPLHANCTVFDQDDKDRLVNICNRISKFGLGYKELATMVVCYRNAPDNVPIILRGSLNQTPYFGIFPRTTDLPVPVTLSNPGDAAQGNP